MMRKRLITILATAALALGAFAAHAGSLPTTQPGPHAAQINGKPGARAQDIYGVEFIEINGQNIPPRSAIWLQPGEYELTVRIVAAGTRHNLMWRTRDRENYNTIKLTLEAGKTYEIRAKLDRHDRRSPYKVIVHNIPAHNVPEH